MAIYSPHGASKSAEGKPEHKKPVGTVFALIMAAIYLISGLVYCWLASAPTKVHSTKITHVWERSRNQLSKVIIRREVAKVLGPLPQSEPGHQSYLIESTTGEHGVITIQAGGESLYGIDCGTVEVLVYSFLDGITFHPLMSSGKSF